MKHIFVLFCFIFKFFLIFFETKKKSQAIKENLVKKKYCVLLVFL